MIARYKSLLILFCLFLLSACAPDTDTAEQVFYRDMQAPLNGVASSNGERSYIQTLGIDYQTMTYNLYCWKNGEVSPVSNGESSSLPFGYNGDFYLVENRCVYRYNPDTGEKERLFTLDVEQLFRAWGRKGKLYYLGYRFASLPGGDITEEYTCYRYDTATNKLEILPWFDQYTPQNGYTRFIADCLAGEWLSVTSEKEDGTNRVFWINLDDGSERDYEKGLMPCVVRNGQLIAYDREAGRCWRIDIESGEKKAFTLPEEFYADDEMYLLAVGEKTVYFQRGCTFYSYQSGKLSELLSYKDKFDMDVFRQHIIIGDTFYFAFAGTAQQTENIKDYVYEKSEETQICYCAAETDGTVHILVKEPYR